MQIIFQEKVTPGDTLASRQDSKILWLVWIFGLPRHPLAGVFRVPFALRVFGGHYAEIHDIAHRLHYLLLHFRTVFIVRASSCFTRESSPFPTSAFGSVGREPISVTINLDDELGKFQKFSCTRGGFLVRIPLTWTKSVEII